MPNYGGVCSTRNFVYGQCTYICVMCIYNRGLKHRGPLRPNYTSNFV